MSPLIPIAVNLLPSIARRLTGGRGDETGEAVASVVREILQTSDPAEAELAARDPAKAAELRIRLAEIEAAAEARQQETDLALRAAERQQQKDAFEAMLARREAEFRDLEARLASQADARTAAVKAAEQGSVYQYGPILMSAIVTIGFFILLYMLIRGTLDGQNTAVLQIINIGFGTLTAGFATVISFWLGSSESSRQKDGVNVQLQAQRSLETREILQRQTEATKAIIDRQSSQTEQLIRRVDRPSAPAMSVMGGGASARNPAKGPRHFQTCVDLIFEHEGGFTNDPDDPRGPTNMGITGKTLAAWRDAAVGVEDIRNLSRDEAQKIYRANYWNALGCPELPAGLDLAMFDFAVASGVGTAAEALQKAVAVESDGEIGPITLGAVAQFDTADLLEDLRQRRAAEYQSRPDFDVFGTGWMRRLQRTHAAALAMLTAGTARD